MATEQIIIEFVADVSGLKSGLESLEDSSMISKKMADGFKATSAEVVKLKGNMDKLNIEVSEEQAVFNKLAASLKTLSEASKAAAVDLLKMTPAQLTEEFKASGITVEQYIKSLQKFDKLASNAPQHLKAMVLELKNMAARGEEGTAKFEGLREAAAKLQSKLDDVSTGIKTTGSDTRVFDGLINAVQGLAGGFAVVQGAQALFGDESEALQETLLKVNATMSILQGLQQVQEVLLRKSAASQLFLSVSQGAATASTEAQTVATGANVVATEASTAATTSLTVAQRLLNAVMALMNPVTAAIVAVVVVATAVYYAFAKAAQAVYDAQIKLGFAIEQTAEDAKEADAQTARAFDRRILQAKKRGDSEAEQRELNIKKLEKLEHDAEIRSRRRSEDLAALEAAFDASESEKERARLKKSIDGIYALQKDADDKLFALETARVDHQTKLNEEAEAARKKREAEEKAAREKALEEEKKRLKRIIDGFKLEQVHLREESKAWKDLAVQIAETEAELANVGLDAIKDANTIQLNIAKGRVEATKILHQDLEIDEKEHQERVLRIMMEGIDKQIKEEGAKKIKGFQGIIADQATLDKNARDAKKILDAQDAEEEERRRKERIRKIIDFTIQSVQQSVALLGELFKQQSDAQQARVDDAKKQVEEQLAAGAITEKQATQRMKKLEQEEKKIRTESAKRDKQIALFQAVVNTASAVMKGFAQLGPPGAAVALALGLAQISLIASRPIPKFRSGKPRGGFEGFGVVGEAGAEMVESFSGERYVAKKEALVWLGKSDKVYDAKQTERILAGVHMNNLGGEILAAKNNGGLHIDYDKLGRAVGENVPQTIWGIKNGDFVKTIKDKLNFTTYLDERRK